MAKKSSKPWYQKLTQFQKTSLFIGVILIIIVPIAIWAVNQTSSINPKAANFFSRRTQISCINDKFCQTLAARLNLGTTTATCQKSNPNLKAGVCNFKPIPSPLPITTEPCNPRDANACPAGQICYQPPMPPCPIGKYCTEALPPAYCTLPTKPFPSPLPVISDTCNPKDMKSCPAGQICYQPPVPPCRVGAYCPESISRAYCIAK